LYGIDLKEMEASDMLDVLHFLYEEDLSFSTIEEARWVDVRRKHIYKELYNEDYKYLSMANPEAGTDDPDGVSVKPYIPPTDFNPDSMNPFGDVLDAPIG
jgi:hypothetical protein